MKKTTSSDLSKNLNISKARSLQKVTIDRVLKLLESVGLTIETRIKKAA